MKSYVSLEIDISNVNLFSTEYLYGVLSPLVYHSFLRKLEIDSGVKFEKGFTITYKKYEENTTDNYNSYNLKSRDLSAKTKGIQDTPTGYISVILTTQIEDFTEEKKNTLRYFILKNRIKRGNILSVEIKSSTNVEDLKIKGFTQFSYTSEKNGKDFLFETIFDSSLFTKDMISPAIVGKVLVEEYHGETKFGKKAFYDTSIIKLTSFKIMKKFDNEVFEKNKWETYLYDDYFEIKTLV